MPKSLTPKKIYERMKEWRNIKKLHQAARERIETLELLITAQREQIQVFQKKDADEYSPQLAAGYQKSRS